MCSGQIPLADGGPGRAELALSLFSRIDTSGFQAMRFHLTAEATAHGFANAVPATFTGIVGNGRGERSQPDTIRVKVRGGRLRPEKRHQSA
jgi:hypothetical protein